MISCRKGRRLAVAILSVFSRVTTSEILKPWYSSRIRGWSL